MSAPDSATSFSFQKPFVRASSDGPSPGCGSLLAMIPRSRSLLVASRNAIMPTVIPTAMAAPLGVGFMVLMAAQAFVFGNSAAIAASQATHVAGAASAMLGVAMAVAGALSAPLATAGGGTTAVPMVVVMVIGIGGSVICLVLGRRGELPGAVVRP